MPKEKEVTNHPCHLLSLPSAKRFWCRHCMTVFEDAITRWRHSRSCRYGVVNNFMRRRELEAKALQNTSVLNPVEARLEQSIQMSDLASSRVPSTTGMKHEVEDLQDSDSFTCFICHQKFSSMEEMRFHVRYPCSNSKIITSHVPHPKHSVPVFIDSLPVRQQQWPQSLQSQAELHQSYRPTQAQPQSTQPSISMQMINSEQDLEGSYENSTVSYSSNHSSDTITPTNIYVNEQGETVIEVENLDLNAEGGELSLAHLLTQLSRQGIVFDKTRSAELQSKAEVSVTTASNIVYTTEATFENSSVSTAVLKEDEGQPTAEDAANTLAQLAGFRSFRSNQQSYEVSQTDEHQQLNAADNCSSSIPGTSRYYTTSSQGAMDITYEYEYSNSPGISHSHSATTEEFSQAKSSAPPQYPNDKGEEEDVDGESIQQIYDPETGSYLTVSVNHCEMEAEEEMVQSNSGSTQSVPVGDELHQDATQHYSEETKTYSDHQIDPSSTEQSVIGQTSDKSDNLIIGTFENGCYTKEIGQAPGNSEILIIGDGKDVTKSSNQNNDKYSEVIEFSVPAESLQEIVDASHLNFDEQQSENVQNENRDPEILYENQPHFTVDSRKDHLSVVEGNDSLTLIYETDGQSTSQSSEDLAASEGTVYVVTSAGILPRNRKDN
ncbi:unnamed protein product [Lymnaea stagnalis]|uniref:C2H2-type domain-containing protein n=1 Tax=Lymnaea stagnalis TaxID=6523 RepID=A0AAV2I3D9_LYMST